MGSGGGVSVPAGLPDWLLLVLFLAFGTPALFSKAAARLPGFLGAAGRWWQRREPATASYLSSQAEIQRIREDYTRLRADYTETRDELRAEIRELEQRADRLEDELTEEKQRFWAAVSYIRTVLNAWRRDAPDADVPDPPELLRPII